MDTKSVISHEVAVAAGPFAPGHLGELTRIVPFEMVDEVLAETGRTQRRIRDLPSRVVVYLPLAGALFPGIGWQQVWQRLTAGLEGLQTAAPTAGALAQARSRLGAGPLRSLFDLLRGPAAGVGTVGAWWQGMLVCAVDGTLVAVPDSPANQTEFIRHRCNNGGAGYPSLRLLVLVSCGTRTVLDAVFGPTANGETFYAPSLVRSLREGMIVLLDRNFAVQALVEAITQTGAHVLVRVKEHRRLPVLQRFPDGSYLSKLGAVTVRVVDCEITVSTSQGRRTGAYRLVTTLTDPHAHPATELIRLYHERWEIETSYLEIKSTILGGRVLRARTPAGVAQEVFALLVTYQILRLAIADATSTHTGTDPDRASFSIALNTARDLLVQAAGVFNDTTVDLVGTIGRRVLADLMPDRRIRTRPRVVKRAISKYNARGAVDRTSYKATISIDILTTRTT
ncbi:IS4 family transposase [Streptomyces hygroscopicus]|uniref:IS4 family transposase n=1 Tax=Streptomyces hygroscopicus TaxID=1912 RepID=UPI000B213DE1|nr:IS4 family transposase [Streptomyces hygroscopicus]GLV79376.1 transposase [Streptomyces hygroscopicus subsp. hygroscopicus]